MSHPDNLANGTLELNTVYQSGNIAMQVQYHEFAASIEDETKSRAAGGKTAYAICPKGEASWIKNGGQAVNGCNCGIGGIGINGNASEDLKRAAYIFAIWSVSRENQYNVLKGLGGTPTRKSVLAMQEVQKAMKRPTTMPNALTFDAVYGVGIANPNFVLGPKIPQANEYHSILAAEVQKCCSGEQSAGRDLQVGSDPARRAERRGIEFTEHDASGGPAGHRCGALFPLLIPTSAHAADAHASPMTDTALPYEQPAGGAKPCFRVRQITRQRRGRARLPAVITEPRNAQSQALEAPISSGSWRRPSCCSPASRSIRSSG